MRRLPEAQVNEVIRVGQSQSMQVSLAELGQELIKLFSTQRNYLPNTALLYFSGHGQRQD